MEKSPFTIIRKEEIPVIVNNLIVTLDDEQSKYHGYLPQLLTAVAVDLDVGIIKIKLIKNGLKLGNISIRAGLKDLLEDWIDRNGNEATLEILLSTFSSNGLAEFAGTIKSELRPKDLAGSGCCTEESENTEDKSPPPLNSVIFEEIYKKLDYEDWENMRLVNRHWWIETLPFWRKSVILEMINRPYKNTSLENFVQIFQKDSNEEWIDPVYHLLRHPYRHYNIHEEILYPPHTGALGYNAFWEVCGSSMNHLELWDCTFFKNGGVVEMLRWLLQKVCPDLKHLRVCQNQETLNDPREEFEKLALSKEVTVANNLETLYLDFYWKSADSKILFEIIPNLKDLTLENEEIVEGLLGPAVNGKFVELRTLTLIYSHIHKYFSPLLRYIQQCPNSLKELCLMDVNLSRDARQSPYNLYTALEQCLSLEDLQLTYVCDENVGEFHWFTDLSNISFPKLKKFKIEFNFQDPYVINFDFNALAGMKKLESCSIVFSGEADALMRRENIKDFLYMGQADEFAPEEFLRRGQQNQEYLSCCENLKTLKLDFLAGWNLYPDDMKLFGGWFPNLEYLEAPVEGEALPFLFENLKRIKTLLITTKYNVDLTALYQAKLDHENVKIVYQNQAFGQVEVVKKQEGHVLLEKCENYVSL